MSGSVKIGVGAELSESDFQAVARGIERQFNAMGQTVAKASKQKFEPISIKTMRDLDDFRKRMAELLKIQTELSRRAKNTGQEALDPLSYNYSKLYTNQSTRIRKMQEVVQYLGGEFSGKDAKRPAWQQIGLGATQAGLRAASGATGGVGGVAAGALGTGMSAGFGAGLMGLLGGVVALGVGKAVSAVAEHIGKAEQNNVDIDKLKRTVGDVGVAFDALKTAVHGSADRLGITFDEAGKLAMQFSKLGNLAGDRAAKELSGELATSVGMARSFGLDPSQTTGVLGQMRGLGVTRNEQDTRRFALLIGEAIGRSSAFAKADEVMEAIGNYATMQTRNSMGGANLGGYAGMLSGMIGSGIAGMDPAGASGMLGRINAALSGGGASGEASQFVSAMVGKQMGLSPLQTKVLMEGGAFATNSEMFGGDSVYRKYMGKTGPSGTSTFYEQTKKYVEGAYAGDSDDSRLLRAEAFGRHTGLNLNQSMAMLSINPAAMGSLSRFGNIADFNASGISGIATAMHGTAGDRQRLAENLLGRSGRGALSSEDAKALKDAMGTDSSDLKELLAKLSAKYGQEETTGSIARDSKALLDNIKTSIADKLVPLTNDMREGILYLAGNREKTGADVLKEIAEKGSEYRQKQISNEYNVSEKVGYRSKLQTQLQGMPTEGRLQDQLKAGVITKAQYDEKMRERVRIETQLDLVNTDILDLTRQKEELIKKEVERLKKEQSAIDASTEAQRKINDAGSGARPSPGAAPRGTSNAASANLGEIEGKLAAADAKNGLPPGTMKAILMQEVGGRASEFLSDPSKYHYGLDANGRRVAPHTGRISTAFGPFGILESTGNNPGYGVSPLKDKSLDEQIRFASEYAAARIRSAGSVRGGLAGYGEGGRYAESVMGRIGTPMPEDAFSARRGGDSLLSFKGSFDPLAITIQTPDGKHLSEPRYLNPYFNVPQFGRPS